jgi:hypothetical protein
MYVLNLLILFQTKAKLVGKIVQAYDIFIEAKNSLSAFPVNIELYFHTSCYTAVSHEDQNAQASFLLYN